MNILKRLAAGALTGFLLLVGCLPVFAADTTTSANSAATWLKTNVAEPAPGDENTVLALLQGGFITPGQEYTQGYLRQVQAHFASGGANGQSLAATARQGLVLAGAGVDIQKDVPQLLAALNDRTALDIEGNEAQCAVLLLFGSGGDTLAAQTKLDLQSLAADVAATANPDGGFGSGGVSDVFSTARTLEALAYYRGAPGVEDALLQGEMWLQLRPNDFGGFDVDGQPSAEATARVILAMASLGYDPTLLSPAESAPLVDALLVFQNEDGSFSANPDTPADSGLSSLCALALMAKYRFDLGKTASLDFSAVAAVAISTAPASGAASQGQSGASSTSNTPALPAGSQPSTLVIVGVLAGIVVLLVLLAVVFAGQSKKRRGKKAPKGPAGAGRRAAKKIPPKAAAPAAAKRPPQSKPPQNEKYTYRK